MEQNIVNHSIRAFYVVYLKRGGQIRMEGNSIFLKGNICLCCGIRENEYAVDDKYIYYLREIK